MDLAAQGLVTWVNFPTLDKAKGTFGFPNIQIDGQAYPVEETYAVDEAAYEAWQAIKGTVIASAITRMVTRVAAGLVARKAAKDSILGVLLSLGTQATLTALDTPDTRSWSTLPARIAVRRIRVPPGKHTVALSVRGARRQETIELSPGGWRAISLTVLR